MNFVSACRDGDAEAVHIGKLPLPTGSGVIVIYIEAAGSAFDFIGKLGNVLTHSLTSPGPRTRHQHSLFPETGSAPETKFDVEAVKLNHGR